LPSAAREVEREREAEGIAKAMDLKWASIEPLAPPAKHGGRTRPGRKVLR